MTETTAGERAGRSAADLDAHVAEAPADQGAGDQVATDQVSSDQVSTDQVSTEDLREALKDVVDPELGINIVDLGLVYDVVLVTENGADVATLDMTLTSAACPLTDMIEDQVRAALVGSGLVDEFRINWVWMPPWDLTKISDDGRDQLRALGFSI